MRRELRGDKRVVDDDVAAFLSGQNVMHDEHMQTSRPGLDNNNSMITSLISTSARSAFESPKSSLC